MRNIQYGVCTLTLGNCMDALNLPSSYIFIWLFFKLPLLSFIGFLLANFNEFPKIVILGSANVHGEIEPCGWKKKPLGGLARKATIVDGILTVSVPYKESVLPKQIKVKVG